MDSPTRSLLCPAPIQNFNFTSPVPLCRASGSVHGAVQFTTTIPVSTTQRVAAKTLSAAIAGNYFSFPREHKMPTTKPAVKPSKLQTNLNRAKTQKPKEPLWTGPMDGEGRNGGVTQGLLSRYLVCPERFRIRTMEGLTPPPSFNHRIEYGNLWHACEEELARTKGKDDDWQRALLQYAKGLAKKYPLQQEQVEHWYNVCKAQFPIYVDYWAKHQDVKDRTPIFQEHMFRVPYKLPSGRTVSLRGKWDAVDLIGKGKQAGIYLQENKSKGNIDIPQLQRQLMFDLQTMFYLIALAEDKENSGVNASDLLQSHDVKGIRYNVIRRPLAGGKGSIKQTQKETSAQFYERLSEIIRTAHGEEWGTPDGENHFFARWKVEVTPTDIDKFKWECLDPVLENLCDDYDWWNHCLFEGESAFYSSGYGRHHHYHLPFGIYNVLTEGGITEYDEYLVSGSTVGLYRAETLFPELES